jgi:hypothetical protein
MRVILICIDVCKQQLYMGFVLAEEVGCPQKQKAGKAGFLRD